MARPDQVDDARIEREIRVGRSHEPVRDVDAAWGRACGERPHFGAPEGESRRS